MLLIAWYCYSRSTLYKSYSSELPDPSILNPLPAYADMEPDQMHLGWVHRQMGLYISHLSNHDLIWLKLNAQM